MPYRYTTFNGVKLPDAMTEDDLGAPPAQSTIADSLAGGFNYLGNNRYYPKRHPIRYRGLFVGDRPVYWVDEAGNQIVDESGNPLIMYDPATQLRSQVDDIKAQHGKWAYLVRRREDDSMEQFKYARLLDVQHTRMLADTNRIARLDLSFEAEGRPWRSTFGNGVTTSVPADLYHSFAVTTDGTEQVRDPVLTATVTSGTVTALYIYRFNSGTNYYMIWTGSLSTGQSLVIDCGQQTVKKAGADAYSGFSLYSVYHNATDWFVIDPGVINSINAVASGGAVSLDVSFFDQWA